MWLEERYMYKHNCNIMKELLVTCEQNSMNTWARTMTCSWRNWRA